MSFEHTSILTLLSTAPGAQSYLFYCEEAKCTSSYSVFTTRWRRNIREPWLLDMECGVCAQRWGICSECAGCRTRFKNSNQLKHHRAYWHVANCKKRKECSSRQTQDKSCMKEIMTKDMNSSSDAISHKKRRSECNDVEDIKSEEGQQPILRHNDLNDILRTNCMMNINEKTTIFHAYDILNNGKKYLVSKISNLPINESISRMNNDEADFQLLMSKFANSLKRKQQHDFVSLLRSFRNMYAASISDTRYQPVCSIPNRVCDLKRMYLEGVSAINKNLPVPDIKKEGDHSYVSIIDCVLNFFLSVDYDIASVANWDDICNKNIINDDCSLFKSQRINNIIDDAKKRILYYDQCQDSIVIPVFIGLWSDDFDPNKSVKNNRQSVWIQTATIFVMNSNGEKIKTTFPISMSKKGFDHDKVFRHIYDDLTKLSSGNFISCYCKRLQSMIKIHADIFCILADQPERRGLLRLSAGNSNVHGRFGFVMNCKQKSDVIRSCEECSNSIKLEVNNYLQCIHHNTEYYTWRSNRCKHCTAWIHDINHELLLYEPEPEFPDQFLDVTVNEVRLLKPKYISIDTLSRCIQTVSIGIIKKNMKLSNAKCYLKNYGFNDATVDNITECAINMKTLMTAKQKRNNDIDSYTEVSDSKLI